MISSCEAGELWSADGAILGMAGARGPAGAGIGSAGAVAGAAIGCAEMDGVGGGAAGIEPPLKKFMS